MRPQPASGDATPAGATLSATIVRAKGDTTQRPTLLTLDIYTDPSTTLERCQSAVDRGYVRLLADSRGKRLSPDPIVPYEHDAEDGSPAGTLFNLGYSLQRASFTTDATQRHLLTPGKLTRLPFETTVVSRKLHAGSRLLVLFDANKNLSAQVNYGTGRDVSDESVADAGEPLQIKLSNDSFIDVPVNR